jgi:hypothetical protein
LGGPQQTSIAVSRSMTASVILRIESSERKAKGMSASWQTGPIERNRVLNNS